MAKTNPTLHYSLFSWDSLDEFAHLDTLRKVIEIMLDDKLAAILEHRCKGGRKDWPAGAMLNAFYAMLVLQYRSVECLRRNLATNPNCQYQFKSPHFCVVRRSAFNRFSGLPQLVFSSVFLLPRLEVSTTGPFSYRALTS